MLHVNIPFSSRLAAIQLFYPTFEIAFHYNMRRYLGSLIHTCKHTLYVLHTDEVCLEGSISISYPLSGVVNEMEYTSVSCFLGCVAAYLLRVITEYNRLHARDT